MRGFLLVLLVSLVVCDYNQVVSKILLDTNQSPMVNMIVIYDTNTAIGKSTHKKMPTLLKDKELYYKLQMIDCNNFDSDIIDFLYCTEPARKKLPILLFTEPLLNFKDPDTGIQGKARQISYDGMATTEAFQQFALPLMKTYSVKLNTLSDWQHFSEKYPNTPKVTYFTNRKVITPFFKAITAHFRNTIAFSHVQKGSPLCTHFGITDFPRLLLNGSQQLQLSAKLQKQINILKQVEGKQTEIIIPVSAGGVLTLQKTNFKQLVLETQKYILVSIPGSQGTHKEWQTCMKHFQGMMDYYEGSTDLFELKINQLPAIIYFPRQSSRKYQKKTFEQSATFTQINEYISKDVKGNIGNLAAQSDILVFVAPALKSNKKAAVLFHNEEIPLSYKVLSQEPRFTPHLEFFHMNNPNQEVIQKTISKKLPALAIMSLNNPDFIRSEQGNIQFHSIWYPGELNYEDLKYFLMDIVSHQTNKNVKKKTKKQTNKQTTKSIEEKQETIQNLQNQQF